MLFGMEHYEKTGDTGFLDRCMTACVGVAALPTQKMKVFIQAHANVSWREIEIKSGKQKGKKSHAFKKRGKTATYQAPNTNWWEFSIAGDVVADLDTDARIINFIKAIDKATKEGHIKDKKHAKETKKVLEGLVATLNIA